MPGRIEEPMAPKGIYSVQKSRSFGGVGRNHEENGSHPGYSPIPPEQGRRTPNLGSLRKKFSKKKGISLDEEVESTDGNASSSWKKKNKSKVSNILKWFKKEKEEVIGETDTNNKLTPKLNQVVQKSSEAKIKSTSLGGQQVTKLRSCSYDSVCSVGSATSSFAFVPVNHYKIGRCVESKKRIAIGLNCGPETYRARVGGKAKVLETDKDVTLKTKYKLQHSESPPTMKKGENFSAISGPQLPSSPLLPSSSDRIQNGSVDYSSDSDSSDTALESISQRGSPIRHMCETSPGNTQGPLFIGAGGSAIGKTDQQITADTKNAEASSGLLPIKPRQLSGQHLHPMTIKLSNDELRRNALTDIGHIDSENGTLKFTQTHLTGGERLGPEQGTAGKPESLPKIWTTVEGQQAVSPHQSYQAQANNPFGETVSLAATLPLKRKSALSPRNSLISDRNSPQPLHHIPGKRKAPGAPSISSSPVGHPDILISKSPNDSKNPFLQKTKKGPAPQPPKDRSKDLSSLESEPETVLVSAVVLAGIQSSPTSRDCRNERRKAMTGSAPTSPVLPQKKFERTNKNEWVLEDGQLRSLRESKQDLSEEKEQKTTKAPLSPRPWYKRNIIKDDKKHKDRKDSNRKAKSPDNLPEIHTSRETIKLQDTNDENHFFFQKISKENLTEVPARSPKLFLRNKLMLNSPKQERPTSRPISGLTGISDLDRQAGEIIRKKNEEEAAKRKANDEKFYTSAVKEGKAAQEALDTIMDNVSRKMQQMNKGKPIKQVNNYDEKMNKCTAISAVKTDENKQDQKPEVEKESVALDQDSVETNTQCGKSDKNLENKEYKGEAINQKLCGVKSPEIEQDVQSMDNVVSDLNSFLASTRKAMSSPSSQKRSITNHLPIVNHLKDKNSNPVRKTQIDNFPSRSNLTQAQTNMISEAKVTSIASTNCISPIIEQVETPIHTHFAQTTVLVGGVDETFINEKEKKGTVDVGCCKIPLVLSADQKSNYSPPPSKTTSFDYGSSLPPPPTQAPLPPLAVERQDGWSCHRCTLINYNAQIWCEACGGKRLIDTPNDQSHINSGTERLAISEKELDTESDDAPPKVGNVMDKMVLFSSMDAKSKETPTLQRRRSADVNKLSRAYSSAMLPIDENPLQKTLERITEKQAELSAKPKEYFNSSKSIKGRETENSNLDTSKIDERKDAGKNMNDKLFNTHKNIIKEQERLLEEAYNNRSKQSQNVERSGSGEKIQNLPLFAVQNLNVEESNQLDKQAKSVMNNEINEPLGVKYPFKQSLPLMTELPQTPIEKTNAIKFNETKLEIVEVSKKEQPEEIESVPTAKCDKPGPIMEVKRSSSFKGAFDFTKTPRAFLSSQSNIPDIKKYIADSNNKEAHEGLECAKEISAKSSELGNISFSTNKYDKKLLPKESNKFNHREFDKKIDNVIVPKLEFLGSKVTRRSSTPENYHLREARVQYFTQPPASPSLDDRDLNIKTTACSTRTIETSENRNQFKPDIVNLKKLGNMLPELKREEEIIPPRIPNKEPHYAYPLSPPRPVTPPRPKSPIISQDNVEHSPPPRPVLPAHHNYIPRTSTFSSISSAKAQSSLKNEEPIITKENETKLELSRKMYPTQTKIEMNRDVVDNKPNNLRQEDILNKENCKKSLPRSRIPVSINSTKPSSYQQERQLIPSVSKQSLDNLFSPEPLHFIDHHKRNSSDSNDSDYPPVYHMSHGYSRTPSSASILDERALSRLGSVSLVEENNYSAFTPEVSRKFSIASISTPLPTPKLKRDFGFISSKKEAIPKPPRRRSKEVYSALRTHSRLTNSSSREQTPVNQLNSSMSESPVRPSRVRGKNYSVQRPNKMANCDMQKGKSRPKSLQEQSPEPLYEILSPPSHTQNKIFHYSSSSSEESDFRTPQASPRLIRNKIMPVAEKSNKRSSLTDLGQSYENFYDNPVLNNQKRKNINIQSRNSRTDYPLPQKTKIIPPRTSQEPIPTPRKNTLSRSNSREQSLDNKSRTSSLTKTKCKSFEPHYKVPKTNPLPVVVNANKDNIYTDVLYEEEPETKYLDDQDLKLYKKPGTKLLPEKNKEKSSFHQENKNNEKVDQNTFDSSVKVELSEQEEKFYDTKEGDDKVLVKKSKGYATLPDGSKYPCVIVQKKSKREKSVDNNLIDSVISPQKPIEAISNYIPTHMPMKPDWFDELKPSKNETKIDPRPRSIIDGILYTSHSLIDTKTKKLSAFNLIEPEVFETYDVCRNPVGNIPESHLEGDIAHISTQPFLGQHASYENTDHQQVQHNNHHQRTYEFPHSSPLSPFHNGDIADTVLDYRKTSAENPFRCKSSQSSDSLQREDLPEEQELPREKEADPGVDSLKALLVGQGEGPGGDLLKLLEEAISKGNHKYAASLAKDLAKLKITSRLTEQESDIEKKTLIGQESPEVKLVKASMFVEDAVSAQGPIVVEVNPIHTVAELKMQIEREFEIPVAVQKWILGKNLVTDDTVSLSSQGVEEDGAHIFLYLVSPGEKQQEPEGLDVAKSPPKTNQTIEPFQKGKYWNYEEDRWSFCESDDEEDDKVIDVKSQNGADATKPDNMTTNKENPVPVPEAAKAVIEHINEEEDWEYYYEDVEAKQKDKDPNVPEGQTATDPTQPKQEKGKPDIEKLVTNHVNARPKIVEPQVEAVAAEVTAKEPDEGWECPVCTLQNPLDRPGCMACTTERPADLGAAAVVDEAVNNKVAEGEDKETKEVPAVKKNNLDAYKQLENLDVIPNAENFECVICFLDTEPGDGVMLRECLHTFCRICLAAAIEHSDSPKVKCPFKDESYSCDMDILDREIKALVSSAVFEKHQKKSVKEAEANITNAFHCKTPDCAGWTVIEDNVNIFKCPLCKRTNCITCQAVHDGMDCKQYQQYTLSDAQDENSKKTREWIDDLVTKGEALHCPSCQVLLLKKWGCDWVRCTYCRTEICWVTKQLRWGPNGRGDTSGGCKCMADGRTKCHKMCNYCH